MDSEHPFFGTAQPAKRMREPADRAGPTPWAAEVEAGEELNHLRDTTEGMATGMDEDVASVAYGGDFYLGESYVSKLSKHHQHRQQEPGGRGAHGVERSADESAREEDGVKTELFARPAMAQPAFFRSGNDFPPVETAPAKPAQTSTDGDDDTDEADGASGVAAAMWAAAQSTDVDIILPVTDPDCALAQTALKGSAALAELKRLMARERINRDVMDTSKSDLVRLQTKDAATGQAAAPQAKGEEGTGAADPHEQDALLRMIRLEEQKMQLAPATAAAGPADEEAAAERQARRRQSEAHQQAKQAKTEHINAEQRRITDEATTEAAEEHRAALEEQRRSLPIHRCRSELLRYIGENAVTIVVGDTGSGKTTQMVQFLHSAGYAAHGKRIGCTQPRRLAAMGVARRVSEEMNCALGTTVGYAVHLDDTTTEETAIKFMTDGVLLREIVKDPNVERYSVIVLDEAHERSVDTDVLMGVLKLAIRRRGDLKLIVTSATMDIHKFSRFFGNAPFYEIPGRTFDVEVQYSPSIVPDYVAEAVFRVCQLHLQAPLEGKHDILVFMTGRDDVYGTCELIKRRLQDVSPTHRETLVVLPCLSEASTLTSESAGGSGASPPAFGVLDPTPAGKRKCVVATNVAETSLTIDGVRYVIDSGFMKTNVFRPKIGMNTLQRYPVSQAQAGQRKGRAGRTTAGICFRLYTEEQHAHEMLVNSVPEIQRSSVDSVVLLLKSIGVQRIAQFDFMDPPPSANTRSSMWHLWLLGLLDDDGNITADGRLALEFPMSPVLSKLLIESTRHGCSVEVVRIVAVVTADPKNLFELPKGKEEVAQQHHGRFHSNESDHLTLLNAFTQFLESGRSWQWASDHYLHVTTLMRACDVLEQLTERLQRLRLPLVACGATHYDDVRYCIAKAFCLQAAQRSGSNWNEYRPLLNLGVVSTLHPSSAVCSRAEMPPYVVYNDLLLVSSKEYLVMVTAVEPEWLVTSSRGLYTLRKDGRVWRPPQPLVDQRGPGGAPDASSAPPRQLPPTRTLATPPAAPPAAPKKTPARTFAFAGGKRRNNI